MLPPQIFGSRTCGAVPSTKPSDSAGTSTASSESGSDEHRISETSSPRSRAARATARMKVDFPQPEPPFITVSDESSPKSES